MIEQLQSEHDEENRLISMGDSDYEYDDNGNQLGVDSAGTSHYLSTYINGEKWNLRMSVREEGIPWTSYSYALDGRRVGKEIAWIENKPSTWENVHYLYDGQNVVYEFGKNHPTVRYTHPLACDGLVCGPTAYAFVDAPISGTVDGAKYYYLYDGLGSVTELIDEDENVVNQYRYTPFGESLLKVEGVFNPYQYTGRRYDEETGQYYYRARMYSPSQGRFLSNDPLGMVDGPNMYAYVRGDPINHRDPSGRMSMWHMFQLITTGHQQTWLDYWIPMLNEDVFRRSDPTMQVLFLMLTRDASTFSTITMMSESDSQLEVRASICVLNPHRKPERCKDKSQYEWAMIAFSYERVQRAWELYQIEEGFVDLSKWEPGPDFSPLSSAKNDGSSKQIRINRLPPIRTMDWYPSMKWLGRQGVW